MPVIFKEKEGTLYYKVGEQDKQLTGQTQTLSISGKNLMISSGNSVTLPESETPDTGWLTPKKQLVNVYWRKRDNNPSVRLYYRRIGPTVYFMIRGTYMMDAPGVRDGFQDDTFPEIQPNNNRGETVKQRRSIGWQLVCFKDNGRGFPITRLSESNPDGSGSTTARVYEGFRPIFPQEIKCRTEFSRTSNDKPADDWIKAKGGQPGIGGNIPDSLVDYYGGKYRYDKFDEMFGYFFISAKNDSNCVMQLRNFRTDENLSDIKFNGVSWATDDKFPTDDFIRDNFYVVSDFDKNVIRK